MVALTVRWIVELFHVYRDAAVLCFFPPRLLWQWDGTKENAPQDQGDSLVRVARVFRVL